MNKFFITILFLFSSLISSFSFAADDGDWWLQRNITVGDGKNTYGKKVYGSAARSVMESVPIKDSTREEVRQLIKRSIAVDKPTASKVGGSMMKRISHYAKTPGIQMIGVLAVTQLLEGIGWILEDGGYVKYVENGDCSLLNDCAYQWKGASQTQLYTSPMAACQAQADQYQSGGGYQSVKPTGHLEETSPVININGKNVSSRKCEIKFTPIFGSPYSSTMYIYPERINDIPPETEKVPLTPALLGAAMLGSGYTDPDMNFDNSRVNTGEDTGVKEIYQHDSSGVGEELADQMDEKLKNAPPTDDAKPSWIGDPKYDDRPLIDDRDDSSDRSWDEKGDEATGGTEPIKDPQTGEATGGQSITIQFPLFCSWASKMCQWYDDWKASDKIHQKFEEDVKNHQKDEKSFWQTVKDWFDWSKKDDDLPERDETDLITELPIEQKTKNINWSAQCPTAQTVPINFHGVTAEITVADFSYLCSLDWLIKPFVIAFASISAAFIIFGFNRGGDDG